MVISKEDKAVLLERLQKARETKAAKVAAKKKETPEKETPASVKEPEPPAPAPVAVPPPAPVPEPTAPVAVPPPAPPVVPDMPDLVAMSKKKPAKKACFIPSSDEDSDEEAELPPKKTSKKKQEKPKYMKIVLYKEPKNAAAFQQLMEAVQDEDPEPEVSPPASASIGRGCKFDIKNKTPAQSRTLPTPQEMMRRAALEFFS